MIEQSLRVTLEVITVSAAHTALGVEDTVGPKIIRLPDVVESEHDALDTLDARQVRLQ